MRTITTMLVMLFAACNLSAQYTIRIDPNQQDTRGALPPVWLKNKLTDGQYDSLALLAKHYTVDYSFFKQRNLDEKRIQKYFTRVGKILKDRGRLAKADANPYSTYGSSGGQLETLKPVTVYFDRVVSTSKVMLPREAMFVLYSSLDGYDAHVRLDAEFKRYSEPGVCYSSKLLLTPYSVSGLKVELAHQELLDANEKPVDQLYIGQDGKSPLYFLKGTLRFEDAMGNKFTDTIYKSFYLYIEMPQSK